jgi:synapsin
MLLCLCECTKCIIGYIATGGSIGSATGPPPTATAAPTATATGGDLSLNLRGGSRGTSAPSSPAKSRESLLQRVQSLTGAARDQGANLLGELYCSMRHN